MSSLEFKPLCNFRRNPCSLEHLASVASAAMLSWRAATMNPANPPKKAADIITLSSFIEHEIDRFMPLTKELELWKRYLYEEIFYDSSRDDDRVSQYFFAIVWSADGTINDEETAREMLKLDDLSAEEKYRIACNNCLIDEIKTLRMKLKTEIDLRRAKRYHPMEYYWECVCRRGKSKTTGLTKYIIDKVFNSGRTLPTCIMNYFLYRLSAEKRISFFRKYYFKKTPYKIWEKFLITLTNDQLVSLFENFEYTFMRNLMRFWMHDDFVVQIWIRIRDTFCEWAFGALLEKLWKCDSTDHIPLSVEILNLAPVDLKYSVFDEYERDPEGWWNRDTNLNDVRLDVAILSTVHSLHAYLFWRKRWFDLFLKYPIDCFEELMNVCYRGEEDGGCEDFKMQVMEMRFLRFRDYCFDLLIDMQFTELNRCLGLFSSDAGRIMDTKRIILRKIFLELVNWFETDKFVFPPPNQLVDFIDGSFESIRSANEFKIEVLSSVNCLKACYNVAGSDLFGWLMDAVWMCSCRDEDFELYKTRFVQLSVELANASKCDVPDVFNDPGWMSFLGWCLDES